MPEVSDIKFEKFQKDILLENKANLSKLSNSVNVKVNQSSKEMSRTLCKPTIPTEILSGVAKTETIIKAHQSSGEDDDLYSIKESQCEVNFSLWPSSVKHEPTPFEGEEYDVFPGSSESEHVETKVKGEQCDDLSFALHEEVDVKTENEDNDHYSTRILPATNQETAEYMPQFDSNRAPTFKCKSCTYQTKYKGNLNTHVLIHGEKTFQCSKCPKKFSIRTMLLRHQLTHKPKNQVRRYQCSNCPYQTIWKGSIKAHSAKHDDAVWYECKECPFKTKWKRSLKNHAVVHINQLDPQKCADDTEWFKCGICLHIAPNKCALQKHLKTHQPLDQRERWECSQCSYGSFFKSELKVHQNMKHGYANEIKKFQCRQCSYNCYRKNMLKRHLLTHGSSDATEWYMCAHCPYKTAIKCNLLKHLKSHQSGNRRKKWKCSNCSYETLHKKCLKKHEIAKHELTNAGQ